MGSRDAPPLLIIFERIIMDEKKELEKIKFHNFMVLIILSLAKALFAGTIMGIIVILILNIFGG